jgi:hypothetical protein
MQPELHPLWRTVRAKAVGAAPIPSRVCRRIGVDLGGEDAGSERGLRATRRSQAPPTTTSTPWPLAARARSRPDRAGDERRPGRLLGRDPYGGWVSSHAGCCRAQVSDAVASEGSQTTDASPRASSCSAIGAPVWSAASAIENPLVAATRRARRNVIAQRPTGGRAPTRAPKNALPVRTTPPAPHAKRMAVSSGEQDVNALAVLDDVKGGGGGACAATAGAADRMVPAQRPRALPDGGPPAAALQTYRERWIDFWRARKRCPEVRKRCPQLRRR